MGHFLQPLFLSLSATIVPIVLYMLNELNPRRITFLYNIFIFCDIFFSTVLAAKC